MTTVASSTVLEELRNEYNLLHLIYHRNHNQHRQAHWWRYLNMLRRHIRKILLLLVDVENGKTVLLRQQSAERIRDIVDYLFDKKVFTKMHYEFSSIIALGQYVTLGLGLVGLISKLHTLLQLFEGNSKPKRRRALPAPGPSLPTGASNEDDMGEAVEYDDPISVKCPPEEKPPKEIQKVTSTEEVVTETTTTSTGANTPIEGEGGDLRAFFETAPRKKKAKKSAMDAIFGEPKKKKKKKTRNDIDSIFGM